MITDDEFMKWSLRYCDIFQLQLDWVAGTLREWRRLFEAGFFTCQEINAALDKLAMSPPSEKRSREDPIRKLAAILHKERANARTEERSTNQTYAERFGECKLCGSTGFVGVPHPRCINSEAMYVPATVASGGPSYYELAVYCSCALGRFLDNEQAEYWERKQKERGCEQRPWTLERYEKFNPNWKAHLEDRRRVEAAMVRVVNSGETRPTVAQTLQVVAEALKMPPVDTEAELDAQHALEAISDTEE